MLFCQNKKSQVKGFIVLILILTAGFLIVLGILHTFQGKVEDKTAEAICRGSVALREKSFTEVTVKGIKAGSVASPLLCRTIDKYIPESKDAAQEDVEKEIAGLMTSCWKEFGEGTIQDVFKQGNPVTKNCFVCYTVSLRETPKFNGEIKATELTKYLFENPHKVSSKADNCKIDGGFCINSENKADCAGKINADASYLLVNNKNNICGKNGKKSCCYTDYECWNKGGVCSGANPDSNLYAQYNEWGCPSQMKCYAKKDDYYSYGDYIQRFGGPGNIIIPTHIKVGETYAISFGSPTGECGLCTYLGLGSGAATVALALALGVPTGGIGTVGVLTVSALFGGGYLLGKGGSEFAVKNIDLFKRDINTVYLTTLPQIQEEDRCNIIKDIRNS